MKKELAHQLFYCEKDHWYSPEEHYDNESTLLPRATLRTEFEKDAIKFWDLLKSEKIDQNDFDFTDFVFPCEYTRGFQDYLDNKVVPSYVNFQGCVFLGAVEFNSIVFEEGVNFSFVNFRHDTYITQCTFHSVVNMYSAIFSEVLFKENTYLGDVTIQYTTFKNPFFTDSTFQGELTFESCVFTSITTFDSLFFEKEVEFRWCYFFGGVAYQAIEQSDHVYFTASEFKGHFFYKSPVIPEAKNLIFLRTRFSQEQPTEIAKHTKGGPIVFFESTLSKNVLFQELDFRKVEFYATDIKEVRIAICDFKRSRFSGRIVIPNEKYRANLKYHQRRNSEFHERSYIWENKRNYYNHLLEFYRSLKVNLMNAKEWTDSGDAYKSEMIIRKRLLVRDFLRNPFKLNHLITLFTMNLHYLFSGFNQSIVLPVVWLLIFWVGFAAYFTQAGYIPHFTEALTESFYALMPLSGGLESSPVLKNALVIERIIGATLISLFALSTRSRFRQ